MIQSTMSNFDIVGVDDFPFLSNDDHETEMNTRENGLREESVMVWTHDDGDDDEDDDR